VNISFEVVDSTGSPLIHRTSSRSWVICD